jgi:hypothetical protein
MKKHNIWHTLLIVGPPLLLVVLGAVIYIAVSKLAEPETRTISAVPSLSESTPSANPSSSESAAPVAQEINPITTTVNMPSSTEIADMQKAADAGEEVWRLDPIEAAERMAGTYGFIPGDQLTLSSENGQSTPSGSATIVAAHGSELYFITMQQPKVKGEKGVWVLSAIEKK